MRNREELQQVQSQAVVELTRLHARIFKNEEVRCDISYGPGWHKLMLQLFSRLEAALDEDQVARFRISQIKEKFGMLRIYYGVSGESPTHLDVMHPGAGVSRFETRIHLPDYPIENINSAIRAAERESARTCYFCGARGCSHHAGGLLRTTCASCDAQWYPARN